MTTLSRADLLEMAILEPDRLERAVKLAERFLELQDAHAAPPAVREGSGDGIDAPDLPPQEEAEAPDRPSAECEIPKAPSFRGTFTYECDHNWRLVRGYADRFECTRCGANQPATDPDIGDIPECLRRTLPEAEQDG